MSDDGVMTAGKEKTGERTSDAAAGHLSPLLPPPLTSLTHMHLFLFLCPQFRVSRQPNSGIWIGRAAKHVSCLRQNQTGFAFTIIARDV